MTRPLCRTALFALVPAMTAATPATAQYAARSVQAPKAPATPIADSYPAGANGDGATTNGYNLSRWAEDWRGNKDPKKRKDIFDELKYVEIAQDGDVYATFSGELRLRLNLTTNPNLLKGQAQRQEINRVVGGVDLHLGPNLRVYGELAHGGIDGQNLGAPASNLRNDLAVQQLFVEARGEIADGIEGGVRVGRQEFTDGSNLLTSARDNNTLRFVLNGVRAFARGKRVRADVFDFTYTRYGPQGLGDDPRDRDRRFTGGVVGYALPTDLFGKSKLYLDPFLYRLRTRSQLWGTTTAREERLYAGVRAWGDVGPVTIDWTVNHQFGKYDGRDVDAWQVFAAQTYKLGTATTTPRVGVHLDYASGGGAFGTGKLQTASGLFGNNIYFSYGLFLTPQNFMGVAPNFTFNPVKALRITTEYQFAWRPSETDAVYRASGAAFARTQTVRGQEIGQVARLQAVWTITPRLAVTGRLEHLNAGDAFTRAGYRDSMFGAAWVSFRF
ncbi:alginate export family protein [Sphingomonas montana]|uniref:alginate export family protein n=1 Tax=Sphingomonas montana TaxID=1843236 RepID=UPI00096EC8C1|nr:alginate export family protein [Sphingomonas montana]